MGAMASQITSPAIVYSTVYSGADQRKHQSSVSLAFVRGFHRGPVNSPHTRAINAENVSIWWRHHGKQKVWTIATPNTYNLPITWTYTYIFDHFNKHIGGNRLHVFPKWVYRTNTGIGLSYNWKQPLAQAIILNQCWVIVIMWTLTSQLQWNFNQNTYLFTHNKASENIVCEMAAILSRGD